MIQKVVIYKNDSYIVLKRNQSNITIVSGKEKKYILAQNKDKLQGWIK